MFERYSLKAFPDAYLRTADAGTGSFPASRIQKGPVLELEERDLSEEGVGFGLPVIKLGLEAVFPGSWRVSSGGHNVIRADFDMNLVGRMARGGRIVGSSAFYRAKEAFSRIHRDHRRFRRGISASSEVLRKVLGLKNVFCETHSLGIVGADYRINDSSIDVDLRFPLIKGCTEVVVLNEQGASWFDTYRDSDGLVLKGDGIGSWEETEADEASFVDSLDGLSFTLRRVEGTRMFRGRELTAGRLAWSGLAYVIPPGWEEFSYSIELSRTSGGA